MKPEALPIAAAAVVGAVCVMVGVFLDGRAAGLTGAVGILALVATICLFVQRAARQLHRSQLRIEQQAQANHKRASEWNYRLTEAVGARGGAGTGGAPVRVVGRGTDGHSWKGHKQAGELIASRVFDAELYSALVGREFASPAEAASHYLSINAAKGFMPTALLDRDRLPDAPRAALQRGDVRPLLTFLRSEGALGGELSPLFDGRFAGVTPQATAAHAGGVVGAFLDAADGSDSLPVAPDSLLSSATLDGVRQLLLTHAREFYASAPSELPRTQSTWDFAAETRWLEAVAASTPMDSVMVSVIMPVKDRAAVVADAIGSVVAQTHQNWELIVVDDGSSDATVEVVRALAEHDPRISVRPSAGQGVSAARNTGLEAAQGDYIAFLDSDNRWVARFLETAVRAMTRDDLKAAYAAVALEEETGTQYRAFQGTPEQLMFLNHIDLNVLVVRADVADGLRFDETLRRWVDHDYAIKVAARVNPVLLPFIGCFYDHSAETDDRITVRESEHWQWAALSPHWVRWEDARSPAPGRISVVIPTYNDSAMTIDAVRSVVADATASALDVEIVIIDNGSRIEIGQEILAAVGAAPGVVYRRFPRNLNFAIGCNAGAILATGELVLFLNNDTVVRTGALRRLRAALDDPRVLGAQPLLVYADETIQTAGTVFTAVDSLPSHFLTGHPPADARGIRSTQFAAVTAAALMMRTGQFRRLRGFDPIFVNGMEDVDLCLRARDELGGHFSVVPDAVVTHLESRTPGRGAHVDENRRLFLERWRGHLPEPQKEILAAAGFDAAHIGSDGRDVPGPVPVLVRRAGDTRLRWGIKIASIPGPRGDMWGDTHFAESLREALEAHGQSAVVHRHGAHSTSAAAMDDVVVVLRGLDRVRPMPGKLNILWVISHPDKVTVPEVREFDIVYAASRPWAEKMTAMSGRPVLPLLQATDPSRFNTSVPPVPTGVPLFVGGVHAGRERGIVSAAIRAKVNLAVYGPGWRGIISDEMHKGDYITNEDLASYYRGSSRVLADHWGAMAAEGFIQNRVFDAVAAGCRVVSDPVEGLAEVFRGAVQAYEDQNGLALLCSDVSTTSFPDDDMMEEIASEVRAFHSFGARALSLVQAATSHPKARTFPRRGCSDSADT